MKAEIIVTRRCNLRCSFCGAVKYKDELSTDQWKATISKLKRWGITEITFSGGEPTLRNDLINLIAYAKNLGFIITLNSNGLLLTQEYLEQLELNGLDNLTVSIDAVPFGGHSLMKSQRGMEVLYHCSEKGMFKKLTSHTTITNESFKGFYEYIIETNKVLPNVLISFDLVQFNEGRDDSMCLSIANLNTYIKKKDMLEYLNKIIEGIKSGELTNVIQTPKTIQTIMDNAILADWYCKQFKRVCIDCDGSIRVCKDHKGFRGEGLNLDLLIDKVETLKEYKDAYQLASASCPGCLWSEYIMDEEIQEEV